MRTVRTKPVARAAGRRGTSMIEIVIMASVAAVMLGLIMTLIPLILRAERKAGQSVWHNRTVARLSRQLRDDVHVASAAAIKPPAEEQPASLVLTLDGNRRMTYTIEEHELTRIKTAGDDVRHRESFFLPPGSALRFVADGGGQRAEGREQRAESGEQRTAAGPPQWVRLVIHRAPLNSRGKTAQAANTSPSPPGRGTASKPSALKQGEGRRPVDARPRHNISRNQSPAGRTLTIEAVVGRDRHLVEEEQ